MANTLKSWMILNNATADIPAAGDTGAHQFDTTLLLPYYDNGSNNVPWRFTTPYCMRAVFQTVDTWVLPTGVGDSFGGTNKLNYHKIDFTRFREARSTIRASTSALSAGAIGLLVYDVTNSQNITPDNVFTNDGNYYTQTTAWTALNSATYTNGDAEFEIQVGSGSGGDVIRVGTVVLELR